MISYKQLACWVFFAVRAFDVFGKVQYATVEVRSAMADAAIGDRNSLIRKSYIVDNVTVRSHPITVSTSPTINELPL
ncbi:MAG: hypothetical protein SAK29_33100 [Scytonema sp. PMC 1069.18]|nr:hypothetical protein [Scytonema sp. PMC 1069.18]MEC4886790.1 hypothetical protein [Scytonema sp. PMC 1070.18]